jgi:hypothetical protein
MRHKRHSASGVNNAGLNMKYYNKFYRLSYKRAVKGLEKAVCLAEISQEAQERQKAVLFYQKYGLTNTRSI